MPQVTEHGENSVQGVVRQTPIPSPASFTFALLSAKFSSTSPSSSDLKMEHFFFVLRSQIYYRLTIIKGYTNLHSGIEATHISLLIN